MSETTVEGLMRFYIDVHVTADEMKTWEPDRLSAFFAGIALMEKARTGDAAPTPPRAAPAGEDWMPTLANINALPQPLRRFIHDLETNADPAGTIRENVIFRDQVAQLGAALAERDAEVARLTQHKATLSALLFKQESQLADAIAARDAMRLEAERLGEAYSTVDAELATTQVERDEAREQLAALDRDYGNLVTEHAREVGELRAKGGRNDG